MTTYQEIIDSMINKIIDNNPAGAQDDYNALMSNRVQDALQQRKIDLAQSLYGQETGSEPDQEEETITDQEETEDESKEDDTTNS